MIKFTIEEIKDYVYILTDNNNNKFSIKIDFIDFCKVISPGDCIYLSNRLINENNYYVFGTIGGKYAKKSDLNIDLDIVTLEINNEKIYLQRYYG